SDESFVTEFHTFVQALRNHHGALDAEAQLARGVLLQFAGGEWRSRVAASFLAIEGADQPIGLLHSGAELLGVFPVCDLNLIFALAKESRVEAGRLGAGEMGIDRPVFFFLKRLDFAFA